MNIDWKPVLCHPLSLSAAPGRTHSHSWRCCSRTSSTSASGDSAHHSVDNIIDESVFASCRWDVHWSRQQGPILIDPHPSIHYPNCLVPSGVTRCRTMNHWILLMRPMFFQSEAQTNKAGGSSCSSSFVWTACRDTSESAGCSTACHSLRVFTHLCHS